MAKPKKSIIDKNIEKFINENFDRNDRNKDASKHFEWFVNSMHICFYSSIFFNSDSKIGKKIGLGSSEGGDAFFISINNFQKIYSLNDDVDEVISYIRDSKNEVKLITFHFIQAKKVESIGWNQVLHLFEIPYKIWNADAFDRSQPLLIKVQEFIDSITNDDDEILKKITHKIEIIFYTIKDAENIDKLKKEWETNINGKIGQLKRWFDQGNIVFDVRGYDFLNSVYQKVNSNEYELNVSKNNIKEIGDDYLIGYITAKELLDSIAPIIAEGKRALYTDVFKNNIRLYLGNETSVNRGIEKTLREESHKFHYYNNGLTITTLFINKDNSRNYSIKPVNIVNGCQTANSIYNIASSTPSLHIEDIKIPVRIIQTESEEDYNNITIRTNNQNGVDIQDLISITEIQKELETKFGNLTLFDKRFLYKRQKTQEDSFDVDFIVQIDDILRASFSTIMLMPNKVSGYFDKTTAKYIEYIFDEILIDIYIRATVLLKLIEEKIEDEDNSEFARLKYHILYLMYKFLNKGIETGKLEEFIRNKDSDQDDEEIRSVEGVSKTILCNLNRVLCNDATKFNNLFSFIIRKITDNYPQFLDLSTKAKEKVLYKPVEKLYRTRATPVFENFEQVFTENIDDVLNITTENGTNPSTNN